MRIDSIKSGLYTTQNTHKTKYAKVSSPVTVTTGTNNILPNFNYFVNFSGYKEDKSLITSSKQALDNTMQHVIDYYSENNYEFQDALEILEKNDLATYQKLTNSEKNFKAFEKRFDNFNKTTLNSIKEVQYGQAHFEDFWVNNSHIGSKRTAEIINTSTGAASEQNINKTLKNLDYEQSGKLREDLIVEWFKNEIETVKDPGALAHEENKKLYSELESKLGKFRTQRFLKQQESYYKSEFNKETIDKIFDTKTSNEQKMEAFNAILGYIENQLETEDAESMKSHLDTILEVRQHLKQGISKESAAYIEKDFKALYDIAIKDWQKTSLPILINRSLNQAIYIDNTEKKTPVMSTIPGYSELSLNQKYFVAKYYEANNNGLKDNMLKQIIQDRDIINPSVVIDTLSLKIEGDKQKYFNQLDTFYDYLKERRNNPNLDDPEMPIVQQKQSFSFISMYLFTLNKLDEMDAKSKMDKLDYLSTLTQDEILIANEAIKQFWTNNELQYLIETEVRKQANFTSINSKMYDELKKINVNLNDIKVKIDNISFSLKDLLDNKYLLKDETEARKAIQNSSTVLANAERNYYEKTPQQQAEIDSKLKETMPVVLDNLIQKTDDKDVIEKLTFIKTKCQNPRTKSNELLGMLKTIAIGRAMGIGMNSGYKGLGKLIHNPQQFLNSTHHPLTDGESLSNLGDGIDVGSTLGDIAQHSDLGTQVLQGAAISTAAHSAINAAAAGTSASSSLSGIFGAVPAVDPVTAAIAITLAAVGAATVSAAKQATKIERQQRELYVEFSN